MSQLPGDIRLREIAVREPAVKLWLIDAAPDAAALRAAEALTSAEERARAERFARLEDRARFLIARASLRSLVGRILGRAPLSLAFETTPFGRPFLAQTPQLSFNVSHSGDHALIGLAAERAIGVDIEAARAIPDALDLARLFFHDLEHRAIAAQAEGAARLAAFYQVWTAKEAVLKALGLGIAEHLKDFEIASGPRGPRLARVERPLAAALAGASLTGVAAPPGYAAAFALV